MKAKDYKKFIEAFTNLLKDTDAENSAHAFAMTLPLFERQPDASIVQLTKHFSKIKSGSNEHGIKVQVILSQMPSLLALLKVQKCKALIGDTEKLRDSLKPYASIAITEVIQSAIVVIEQDEQKKLQTKLAKEAKEKQETELVYSYVSKLESALGDESRFPEIIKEMENKKPKLSVAVFKKIALQFSKRTASEINNKKKAISAIEQRHEALMIGRAKSEATGKTIAA